MRNRKNIIIGVLTGLLVGFVFGAAFGTPGNAVSPDRKNLEGDISKIPSLYDKVRSGGNMDLEKPSLSDTLKYEARGENGEDIEILVIKKQ